MNNPKIEITKYVINQLKLSTDDKTFRQLTAGWWKNIRKKQKGGMSLTERGFEALKQAEIKNYRIKFDEVLQLNNQVILGLDNFINTPFYVTHREIYVFDETTAIQIILFNGNLKKFVRAKRKSLSLD